MKKGRKSVYEKIILPRWAMIEKLLKKGIPEKEICDKIGVSLSSWYKYKAEIKEFSELCSAREVDEEVISEVRSALHRKAIGYQYVEIKKITERGDDGKMHLKRIEETTKTAEPDTNAINLFLKNYDKANWANDPQMLEIKKRELELKEKEFENNNW